MRIRAFSVLVILASTAILAPSVSAQRGGGGPSATCRAADSMAVVMVNAYKEIATSTDSIVVASRQRQQLPAVAASQVSYVTDNAICSKVEAPYSAALSGNGIVPSLQVHVIKVGTVYVVWDPVQVHGDYQAYMTISNKYKVLAKRSG